MIAHCIIALQRVRCQPWFIFRGIVMVRATQNRSKMERIDLSSSAQFAQHIPSSCPT